MVAKGSSEMIYYFHLQKRQFSDIKSRTAHFVSEALDFCQQLCCVMNKRSAAHILILNPHLIWKLYILYSETWIAHYKGEWLHFQISSYLHFLYNLFSKWADFSGTCYCHIFIWLIPRVYKNLSQ